MADPKLRGAMPPLDLTHLIWILDWARAHCADEIERLEIKVLRCEEFPTLPICSRWGYQNRHEKMQEATAQLATYRTIFAWLEGAMHRARDSSNEQFAAEMADYIKQNYGKSK